MPAYTFLHQPPAGTWAASGKPGGIPTGRTVSATISSTNDTTDRTTTIQNALNACPSGQNVVLGSGPFSISSHLSIPNGVALVGSGKSLTTVIYIGTESHAIKIGANLESPSWKRTPQTITSAVTAGTTVLTVADTTLFTVGQMMRVETANQQTNATITAGAVPVLDLAGATFVRNQIVSLSSKTGTTLTITPGLLYDSTGLTTQARPGSAFPTQEVSGCGLQGFTLDTNNTTSGMSFPVYAEFAQACWIYDVKVKHGQSGYGIFLSHCFQWTIKFCGTIGKPKATRGTNGGGLLFGSSGDGVTSCLIEDNYFTASFPNMEIDFGSSGNVFAYNYFYDSEVPGLIGGAIDTNHGAHNCMNLYEGNIASNLQADGFFGTVSEDTIFRNYLYGTGPSEADRSALLLKRFTSYYQVVSNRYGGSVDPYSTFGQPTMGFDGSGSGNVNYTSGTFWADWPNSGAPGSTYQENDNAVTSTTTLKGNYWNSGTVISGESLGGQTLPDSLYLAGKPSWFYGLSWPLDPSTTLTQNSNPAGYRYNNSDANPPSGATSTSSSIGKATFAGKVTIL